jgi:hypothetical protein
MQISEATELRRQSTVRKILIINGLQKFMFLINFVETLNGFKSYQRSKISVIDWNYLYHAPLVLFEHY